MGLKEKQTETCQCHGLSHKVVVTVSGTGRWVFWEVRDGPLSKRDCVIDFEDGTEVQGSTFECAGDEAHMKKGSFNLKDW
ncbi:hypothetical protein AAE478_003848 [Parahypoxylon ruwenzoriense]